MEALKAVNAGLKNRGIKGRIVVSDKRFLLRGTFTAADGTRKDRRVPLGLPGNELQLLEAETRAITLAGIIASTGFIPSELPWEAPKPQKIDRPESITVREAVKQLKTDFWQGKVPSGAADRTWLRLKAETDRLPADASLTVDLLAEIAKQQQPGTRTRQEFLKVSKRLAKLVGLGDLERLDALRTPYEPSQRDVPSQEAVAELVKQVANNPEWGCCMWALATYGCRPAEVFSLRPAGDGTAQVISVKRKGKLPTWRTALALPVVDTEPERSVPWDVTGPSQYDSVVAKRHTDRWAGWLRRQHPTIQLYDLRHAWAIRSIGKLPSTSMAAKCMGHDIGVHHRTYHRWLDKADIAAAAAAINRQSADSDAESKTDRQSVAGPPRILP